MPRRKFYLRITDFSMVGGIHYYGNIYYGGVKVKELDQPEHNPDYPLSRTIRFWSLKELIKAAKRWFLKSKLVKPGDQLVCRKIELEHYGSQNVRHSRVSRKASLSE